MKREVFVRSAYNYDMDQVSDETGLDCQKYVDQETGEVIYTPSMTQQHFAEECDINTILKRFGITGQLPQNVRMPTVGDFTNIPTYHEALNAIRQADEAFMELPAEVRSRFQNDAGAFVDFCSDEKNRAEAEKLGLVPPRQVEPVPAPVQPAVEAPAPAQPAKS